MNEYHLSSEILCILPHMLVFDLHQQHQLFECLDWLHLLRPLLFEVLNENWIKDNYFFLLCLFLSFHWMTYNVYYFEYSNFCLFGFFWWFCKCLFYTVNVESDMWAQKLSPPQHSCKLWSIVVISNGFLFYASRVCYQHKWKDIWH